MRYLHGILLVFVVTSGCYGAQDTTPPDAPEHDEKPTREQAEVAKAVVMEILGRERRTTFHDPYEVSIDMTAGKIILDNSKARWIAQFSDLDPNAIDVEDDNITKGRAAYVEAHCLNRSGCVWHGLYKADGQVSPEKGYPYVAFYVYRSSGEGRWSDASRDLEAEKQITESLRTLIRYFQRSDSLSLGSGPVPPAKEPDTNKIEKAKEMSETFQCERSHAGGFRYIPCEMTFSDAGIRWKFLETFTREEVIPWAKLDDWEAYGKTYGYTLTLTVSILRDGGGSFKFSSSDLDKVVEILRRYVPNRKKTPEGLR